MSNNDSVLPAFPLALEKDDNFENDIKPFILEKLDALKLIDEARAQRAKSELPEDYRMNYRFYDHARRAAEDMRQTALSLGADNNTATALYWAMLGHDIGKAQIPVELWDMTEKPEEDIKAQRRAHTDIGVRMVRDALDPDHPFTALMIDIIGNHHEQMDGKGFKGLTGKDLSPYVRLACIIESFDGYSRAPYHDPQRDVSIPSVLKRMREEKGADLYDMDLFEAFAEIKMKEYKGSRV